MSPDLIPRPRPGAGASGQAGARRPSRIRGRAGDPDRRRKPPLLALRRMMLAVAVAALAMASSVHPGDRPGVYLKLGRYSVGVSRNDQLGRWKVRDGEVGGFQYEAGVWDSSPFARPIIGVWCQGWRLWAGCGARYWML
jgi:hypothetical protein